MMCQKCKKQSATVHLTTVVGSEMQEKHLCSKCASEDGETATPVVPLDQLVKKFVAAHADNEEVANLVCAECGMTFTQFRNTGLLGCPADYKLFSVPLKGLLERAHGGRTQHVGKIPGDKENKRKRQHELMRLKQDLDDAVGVEDYERAAVLRDTIAKLER